MTFDNSKKIIGIRIRLFGATVIFLAYLVLAYVSETIKFPLLGLNDTTWTVVITAVWLFIALLPMLLSYQYIMFSDDTEKIVLRYFNAGIVGGRKNSLEIDKISFAGYKTETSLFGLVTSLILFQRFSDGVAKYPPVYISALTRDEKAKLYKALSSYIND